MRDRHRTSNERRILLAAVLAFLSLVAHVGAAGSLPSATAILGGGLVSVAIAWALVGRRRSVGALVAILFGGQLLIHGVVVALGHHGVSYLPDQPMIVAHLLAAGIAAILFSRGEQIVAAWLRAAARVLGLMPLSVPAIASERFICVAYRLAFARSIDGDPCCRRGPPLELGGPAFA